MHRIYVDKQLTPVCNFLLLLGMLCSPSAAHLIMCGRDPWGSVSAAWCQSPWPYITTIVVATTINTQTTNWDAHRQPTHTVSTAAAARDHDLWSYRLACQVQIPEGLGAALLAQHLNPGLSIPLLAPGPPCADLGLDFDAVVGLLRQLSDLYAIPPVPVPSLSEHRSAPLEISVLRTPDARTTHVGLNYEACHCIARCPKRYVGEHLVELLQLLLAASLLHNTSVLSKAPEVKSLDDRRHDDEGRLA